MKALAAFLALAMVCVPPVRTDAAPPGPPSPPSTQPQSITYDDLLVQLRGNASQRQIQTMQKFAQQADSPEALPKLLALLKEKNEQLDNNACLAITYILMIHKDANCPLDGLLETLQRRVWTSQQKAAQALAAALKPENIKGHEEEICRAVIPLLTSQRSRVYNAALACLRKVTDQKELGPDPAAWKAWFEKTYPGKPLDLSNAVFEMLIVVKILPDDKGYTVDGAEAADAKALNDKLTELSTKAKEKGLALQGVVQVPNEMMEKLFRTGNLGPVQKPMMLVAKATGGGCTVSPEADAFRKVYSPPPTSQP